MPNKRNTATTEHQPASFLEMRSRIAERYPELSPQLQTIAQFALSNPETMAVETAVQLAARLSVQPSSLVRFAHALGYRGFSEMKRGFRANLIYIMAANRDQQAVREASSAPANGALGTLLEEGRAELDWLAKGLDQKVFQKAATVLAKADQIYVVAQHIAYPFASMFAWTLLRFGRQCHLLDNTGGFALRHSELAGKADVTLAISLAPYHPSVVQGAKAHAERGGKIVAITDTLLSPLAPYADILLEVPQHDASAGQSFVATTCLVQALAVAVSRLGRTGRTRS